jgi:hypothetical protein
MKWWLVAKFMKAAAESGWPDKVIVDQAMEHYHISRTDAYGVLKEVKSRSSG